VPTLGWVGFSTNDNAASFDLATGTVGTPFSLLPSGDYPYDATFKPDGTQVWIAGASGDGVAVIDVATGSVVKSIDLTGTGDYPVDVSFNAAGTVAWVSSRDSGVIIPIDTATYVPGTPIPLPSAKDGGKAVFSPCNGKLYVTEWYGNELITVDPVAGTATAQALGGSLWDMAITPNGQRLYILDRGGDQIVIYDTATAASSGTISPLCNDPWGIDITPDGSTLVVACEDDHTVRFVATSNNAVTTLSLASDSDPRDVQISANGATAWVPTGDIAGADGVYVIDIATQTLTSTITFAANAANANVVAAVPADNTCGP
jgi:DNA-binding beta-propeller fold protein YncE